MLIDSSRDEVFLQANPEVRTLWFPQQKAYQKINSVAQTQIYDNKTSWSAR